MLCCKKWISSYLTNKEWIYFHSSSQPWPWSAQCKWKANSKILFCNFYNKKYVIVVRLTPQFVLIVYRVFFTRYAIFWQTIINTYIVNKLKKSISNVTSIYTLSSLMNWMSIDNLFQIVYFEHINKIFCIRWWGQILSPFSVINSLVYSYFQPDVLIVILMVL